MRLVLIALIVLPSLAALTVGALFLYGKHRFEAAGPHAEPRIVMLSPGMGVRAIATRLDEAGVISDRQIFLAGVRLSKADATLKAGEYEIPAYASMSAIVGILREGRSILHRITIPEGRTSEQAMLIVAADPILVGEVPRTPPEGALLPETYSFTRGATRAELVVLMQKAASDLMAELWAARAENLPFNTPEEAIILASIVEKETGVASERPRVAAVFVNRLRKPMRLQSDPTIIYGLVGGKGALGRPIRRSEIDRPTAYNTYQIDGLPPTPIANPGRASIEAVLNPPVTDEYYFVADGTGGHVFSRTLAEHQRRVLEWRRIEREKARGSVEKEAIR
ncbi:MAG: endolytic transglycosylase MltG [Parvibaculum sp.]|uniref:endolytic transglycosylase MltG n=1 Tax=Parvibaculum sp. TaxID=2024848 RepID=UPI00271E7F8E|nr:endolytic transglycosylase MltG [Parvibaculum sp.]MDO8838247.1 endolytic transglycosylase MltG [Parvibaculum sp.]